MDVILRCSCEGVKAQEKPSRQSYEEDSANVVCNGEITDDEHQCKGSASSLEPGCLAVEDGDMLDKLEEEALTPRQVEILRVRRRVDNHRIAAAELGVTLDHIQKMIAEIRSRLSRAGIAWRGLSSTRHNGNTEKQTSPKVKCVGITTASLLELIKAQDYRCALSGVELTPETAQLDHKQPMSAGGKHELGNVWFVHKDVNRAKSTMTVDEFVQMCLRVVRWTETTKTD